MVLVIVLAVVAFVVLASAGFVVATRTRPRPPAAPPAPTAPPPSQVESAPPPSAVVEAGAPLPQPEPQVELEIGPRPALRDRLGRARAFLGGYLEQIRGRGIDDATFEELEEALLLADVGVATTTALLDDLRARVKSGDIERTPEGLIGALRADLEGVFSGDSPELALAPPSAEGPTVWLFVGVNGVGKTTTIGKIAARQRAAGHKVVLAAGDTFRAAAGEQLETWAGRAGASLIRGSEGADPSSVIFDAVQHAAARGADIVLADTAGRLHTKVNLMDELRKVRRIAERPPAQLTEVLLVLDATTGQNGLVQARQFTDAVGVTGVVLTKLDGTAKGGVVLAIRNELGLPIKLVGVGESVEDLVEFDAKEFVSALFE
jgi:fused signal recognition particle receptor